MASTGLSVQWLPFDQSRDRSRSAGNNPTASACTGKRRRRLLLTCLWDHRRRSLQKSAFFVDFRSGSTCDLRRLFESFGHAKQFWFRRDSAKQTAKDNESQNEHDFARNAYSRFSNVREEDFQRAATDAKRPLVSRSDRRSSKTMPPR